MTPLSGAMLDVILTFSKVWFATYESSTAVKEMFLLAATSMDPIAIVVYCNKNRHRSVALGWLLAALRTDSPKPVKLIHHNARRSWSQMYGQCKGECDECMHKTPEIRQAANRCVCINSLSFHGRHAVMQTFKLRSSSRFLR